MDDWRGGEDEEREGGERGVKGEEKGERHTIRLSHGHEQATFPHPSPSPLPTPSLHYPQPFTSHHPLPSFLPPFLPLPACTSLEAFLGQSGQSMCVSVSVRGDGCSPTLAQSLQHMKQDHGGAGVGVGEQ